IPLVREYLTRRLAGLPGPVAERLRPLVGLLARSDDPGLQRDVLRGVQEALSGRRQVPRPDNWADAYTRLTGSPSPEVRERALTLAVLFDDERALVTLRQIALDAGAEPAVRQRAVEALVYRQKPDVVPLLQGLLSDRALRGAAVRGLAAFNDEA